MLTCTPSPLSVEAVKGLNRARATVNVERARWTPTPRMLLFVGFGWHFPTLAPAFSQANLFLPCLVLYAVENEYIEAIWL